MNATEFRPHRCGIVLAGGDGKRLQHFVRNLVGIDLPKQYVSFIGTRSMLEHTFDRAEQLISPECIFTVVARDHLKRPEVQSQLRNRPQHTVVVQPMNRETGPGLLLPLMHLFMHYPNSTVAVFPSDHFVLEEDFFMAYVRQAFEVVERYPSKMVILGVEPTDLEPEYGYILPEKKDPDSASSEMRVKAFIEKPEPQIAAHVTALGALWNTMTMVFKPQVMLHLVGLSAPNLYRSFQQIFQVLQTSNEMSAIEDVYRDMAPMNFSKGLLEGLDIHSRKQLYVISMKDVFWSDWGSEARIISVVKRLHRRNSLPGGFPINVMVDQLPEIFSVRVDAGL